MGSPGKIEKTYIIYTFSGRKPSYDISFSIYTKGKNNNKTGGYVHKK